MFHSKFRALWRPAVVCLSTAGTVHMHQHPVISRADIDPDCQANYDSDETLLNWSSTHSSTVSKLYAPLDEMEVVRLLEYHTKQKAKLRPVGTALSPNVSVISCPTTPSPPSFTSSTKHLLLYSCQHLLVTHEVFIMCMGSCRDWACQIMVPTGYPFEISMLFA